MFRPTPTNVVAVLALFVSLGGTGYAVSAIPRNSVGAPQIKAGAVRSADVRNGSLRAADFASGVLSAPAPEPAPQRVPFAGAADTAATADLARHALTADDAKHAETADRADLARRADLATRADRADRAQVADTSDHAQRADVAGTATRADDAARAGHAETADNAARFGGLGVGEFVRSDTTRQWQGWLDWSATRTILTVGPIGLRARCVSTTNGDGTRTDRAVVEGFTTAPHALMFGPHAALGGGAGPTLTPTTPAGERVAASVVRTLPESRTPRPATLGGSSAPVYVASADGRTVIVLRNAALAIDFGADPASDTPWRACQFNVNVDVLA